MEMVRICSAVRTRWLCSALYLASALVACGKSGGVDGGGKGGASGGDASLPAGGGQETILFKMESVQGVQSNPPQITTFTLEQTSYITRVWTYHYNATVGAKTPTVAFKDTRTGALFGPWPQVGYKTFAGTLGATASDPGNIPGPPDNYWMAYPGATVPAGTYQVIDSEPVTWSYTSDLGNRGVTWVYGWAGSGSARLFDAGPNVDTGRLLDAGRDAAAVDGGTPVSGYVDNRGNKGTITLGQTVAAVGQTVQTSGGTITYSKPGDPLSGLQITVPASAYAASTTFNISYAPILGQDFGSLLNPLTPMIKVDNGGVFSDELIDVKVPVKVLDGYFAMAFTYDEKTRTLEGLPTVTQDADSLTFATRHFSDFFITQVADSLLKPDIDSDFRPGIDDWQFANYGSYIAPGGHCTGQSMTAMWYYITQPDGANLTLFGRYDNNGEQPPTPNFQDDDSLGYRFASVVWKDMDWDSWSRKFTEKFVYQQDINTWRLFAYAMQLTGEPQMTEIWDTVNGGGHAMVVYRIKGGNLYIADPNYPANTDRRIAYANEKFSPYESALEAQKIDAGSGKTFDKITYVAKSSLINWSDLTAFWQQVKNKTIGNGMFPDYQIVWKDDKHQYQALNDGYISTSQSIDIEVTSNSMPLGGGFDVYRNGVNLDRDSNGNFILLRGTNNLGMDVYGNVQRKDSNGNTVTVSEYVDFKYIKVIFGGPDAGVPDGGSSDARIPDMGSSCHFQAGIATSVTLGVSSAQCNESNTLSFCFTPQPDFSIAKSASPECSGSNKSYSLVDTDDAGLEHGSSYTCNTLILAFRYNDTTQNVTYPDCVSPTIRTRQYADIVTLSWDVSKGAYTISTDSGTSGTIDSSDVSDDSSCERYSCSAYDLQVTSAN